MSPDVALVAPLAPAPVAARTARLRTIDEPALPFREHRLARALGRLDAADAPVELALLVDSDGLLVAAGDGRDHDETAGAAAVALAYAQRLGGLHGHLQALTLELERGRVLEVRPVGLLGALVVTLAARPIEAARFERVARELRLCLA